MLECWRLPLQGNDQPDNNGGLFPEQFCTVAFANLSYASGWGWDDEACEMPHVAICRARREYTRRPGSQCWLLLGCRKRDDRAQLAQCATTRSAPLPAPALACLMLCCVHGRFLSRCQG